MANRIKVTCTEARHREIPAEEVTPTRPYGSKDGPTPGYPGHTLHTYLFRGERGYSTEVHTLESNLEFELGKEYHIDFSKVIAPRKTEMKPEFDAFGDIIGQA